MKILFAIFLVIMLAAFASAEVNQTIGTRYGIIESDGSLTTTSTIVSGAQALGFICANGGCSSTAGTLWNGNPVNANSQGNFSLTFPTTLQSEGYGIFFYKTGYIPYEIRNNFAGNGQAPFTLAYLTQKRSCSATLSNTQVSTTNTTISVSAIVNAPIQHSGPLDYVPSAISSQYESPVSVRLTTSGPTSYTETKNVNVPFSGQQNVNFSFAATPGNYTISLVSNVTGTQCITSIAITSSTTTSVINMTNTTIPPNTNMSMPLSLSIVSPQNITYNTNSILVQLSASNAQQVFYSINNGANQTYSGPVTVFFQNGTNNLRAFASNSTTTISASVTFSVVPTTNMTNMSDVTPPGSITNLNLVSKSHNFILWNWTNPTDPDFSQAIIYINGVNVANTSNNFYNATGLSQNTFYTITVNTKDFSGNVNTTNVSNTQVTDTLNTNPPNNPGSTNNGKRRPSRSLEIEEAPIRHIQEEVNETLTLDPRKSQIKFNWWLPLLLLLACLLLLLLILLAASQRSKE